MGRLPWLVLFFFATGCWQGPTAEGAFRCSTDSECPPDWVCVTGVGGGRCFSDASSAACDGGSCMDGGRTCGGCLEPGSSLCLAGTASSACGASGGVCAVCDSSQQCVGGACVTRDSCAPGDCEGCCAGSECVTEGRADACGGGGAACIACNTGEVCSDGECVVPSTCTPDNCAGCCDGDTCRAGTADVACGSFGDVCSICEGSASCLDGVCQLPCAERCGGCCDGEVCLSGDADLSCGAGGDACFACSPDEVCDGFGCVDRGCSETCGGCCDDGVCLAGGDDGACGSDGMMCLSCGSSFGCLGGACEVDPASLWDVFVERAAFPTRDADGTTWDVTGNPLPDARATVEAEDFGSPVSESTSTLDNTVTPAWSEQVLTRIRAVDLMRGIRITVVDVDSLSFNDVILVCDVSPTSADFRNLDVLVSCEPSPSASTSVSGVVELFLFPS